jgi:hypothetical protein
MYTYSTGQGITPGGTIDDAAAEATEEVINDSEIDDIIEMEKRDFDDVEGIESDLE